MQTKDKLKLAKIKQEKKKQAETKKQELSQKRAESKAKAYQKYVDELKDKLNELKQGNEGLSDAVSEAIKSIDAKEDIKSLENALKDLKQEIEKGISVKNIKDAKSVIPEYKPPTIKTQEVKIPKDLAKDASIQKISKILEDIDSKLEPDQKPEKFIPYRRVRWNGTKYEFDDTMGGGGGSGSSAGGVMAFQKDGGPVNVSVDNPVPVDLSAGDEIKANLEVDGAAVSETNRVPISVDLQKDIFGHIIVSQQYNQIELRLDASDWADFVTETNANGGDTTQSGGMANISTSTATNGSAILASNDSVEYRPGVGIFGAGTAIFTQGVAGANQYVGLGTDTSFSNGVQFGYKGTSFGIRYMRGGSEVSFTAQADWDDPCQGGASSLFTRAGVAETLDPTKPNLYRVRAGLFGFAGWDAQVWSPDNGWITVLTYRNINQGSTPVFTSNTFKVVLSAVKTSGATNVIIKSQCWAAGTGSGLERLGSTLNDRKLAQTVRSVLAAQKPNGDYVNIDATAGGNIKVSVEEIDPSAGVGVNIYETSTPLNASASVDSGWLDVSNYDFVEAVLYTDQNSATDGAVISLSSDGGTTTEKSISNTITGGVGAFAYNIPLTAFDAVKITYTNGGTNQGAFHIIVYGQKGANPIPIAPLGAGLNSTLSAMLTRAVLAASKSDGTIANLVTTAGGFLQTDISQIDVDVPVKALTTLNVNQAAVGTSAVQISSVATDRKTISIKSLVANTDEIYVGTSNAVTTSSGYELSAGDAVEFDLTEGQALWAISGSVSQRICWAEISD